MDKALLQTKFHIPQQPPSSVLRQHLLSRLNQELDRDGGFRRRLTLITAPAGYGKTTLAVSWIAERVQAGAWQLPGSERRLAERANVVWLSLADGDDQEARFFRYLFAAIRNVDDYLRKALPRLEISAPLPSVHELTGALVNSLAAVRKRFVLVLDDYHHVAGTAGDQALEFLLRHQPANLHVLLTSRGEPEGLPLAQLSAQQQMMALDQADLSFTPAESRLFLRSRIDWPLADDDLEAVVRHAAGWAGGLQLISLALQQHKGESGRDLMRVLGAGNRRLSDYLVEEVLTQLSPVQQAFLLRTSIVDQLCASLCHALTEPEGADRIPISDHPESPLAELAARGFFLTGLDGEGQWYRYHPLFASFLRSRLWRRQPQRVPQLHRRAAEWYRANGSPHDAVHHALASKDTVYALEMIEGYLPWLLRRGELTTLITWLDLVSRTTLRSRPLLALNLAWAYLLQGLVDRAAALATTLEPFLEAGQRQDVLAIRIAVARRRGNIDAARRFAKRAAALQPPANDQSGSVIDLYQAELQMGRGELAQARRLITNALQSFRTEEQPYLETQALYYLINVHITQGQLQEAAALCEEALTVMERRRLPFRLGGFHNRLGLIHWEWGKLREAANYLEKGTAIARNSKQAHFFVHNALLLASVWRDLGKHEPIATLLDEARHIAAGSPQALAQLTYWQAWSTLQAGQPAAATQWVAARGLAVNDDPDYYTIDGYLLLARLLRMREQRTQARRLLRRLLALARRVGDKGTHVQILLELVTVYFESDHRGLATKMVEEALVVGSPGGYVQRFINAGAPLGQLLQRVNERYAPSSAAPFADDYLQRVLSACDVDAQDSAARLPFRLSAELTARETEILHLLAQGLRNPDIAARLHISVGTVRWHVKNIYRKLGVNNRVQAARRLQALDS